MSDISVDQLKDKINDLQRTIQIAVDQEVTRFVNETNCVPDVNVVVCSSMSTMMGGKPVPIYVQTKVHAEVIL